MRDEIHGACAAGALLVGELDEAEEHLTAALSRYLAGFFLRLAVVTPDASFHLAWRVARRRLVRPGSGVPSRSPQVPDRLCPASGIHWYAMRSVLIAMMRPEPKLAAMAMAAVALTPKRNFFAPAFT